MASIRELRSRIRSVQATKKITKAQELIAASRITKAQKLAQLSEPYASRITEVIGMLASRGTLKNPFLYPKEKVKRVAILVITSDSGQCGGYNANIFKESERLISKLTKEDKEPQIFVTGRKGISHFTFKGVPIKASWSGFSQNPTYANAVEIGKLLESKFLNTLEDETAIDEIYLIYTKFVSMLTQNPQVVRLAPVEYLTETEEIFTGETLLSGTDRVVKAPYNFEPDAGYLLGKILPKYLYYRIHAAMLAAAASENAARRTAMKAATDNAEELEKDLSRQANQVRQASITQEISEIVGGAGALEADSR